MLPRKRKRPKMGVGRPRTVFNAHRNFVRRHSCSVPGCAEGNIQFAHVRSRGAGGHDSQGVSLCLRHHREQHDTGIETFQRKYGIDLLMLAAQFARYSPDKAMQAYLQEQEELKG